MPGVETTLMLLLTLVSKNEISLFDVVNWTSFRAAKIYGIPNKGEIKVGYDADLVLVDLKASKILENSHMHTKVKWTPYEGVNITGLPLVTIVNGNIVYQEGEFFLHKKGKEIKINSK